jgi:transcriptional regulator with XRE-family HTH domain
VPPALICWRAARAVGARRGGWHLISSDLARNVAALRRGRQLTQAQLARLAGLPRSTLTWIESGEGNPSLRNLVRLAGALQVGIEELLSRPRADTLLVPADRVPVQVRAGGSTRLYKLLPDPLPGMEIDRLELEPGARLRGVPHLDGTREYLTVTSGEIALHVAGESYRVTAGDVLAFPGDRPHSYHNPGRARALALSVVALAGAHAFGAGRGAAGGA